jgi:hypothetical protein
MVAYYDGGTGGTSSVWSYWNTGTTTTSSTSSSVWYTWVTPSVTTSTTSATTLVWNTWVDGQNNRLIIPVRAPAAPALVLTPEQIESERVRREERDRLWKAQQAARKAAEDRAQELLMAHLTEAQREAIKARNFFIVEGGKSKEKYRIWTTKGIHGNIEKLDKAGKAVANLCVQLKETVCPNGDHFLAQKLMLELAEDDILKVANMTRMAA